MVSLSPREPQPLFDYVVVVPEPAAAQPWRAEMRDAKPPTGDPVRDRFAIGRTPAVQVVDYLGPDLQAAVWGDRPKRPACPGVRSRVTLTASEREAAVWSSVSFSIHRRLAACLRPGDRLHIAEGDAGGIAVSAIREERLLVAVGALAGQLILGGDVSVRIARDLLADMDNVFLKHDPQFRMFRHFSPFFPVLPLEISSGGSCRVTFGLPVKVGSFVASFSRQPKVTNEMTGSRSDECLALIRSGVWPEDEYVVLDELLGGLGPIERVDW